MQPDIEFSVALIRAGISLLALVLVFRYIIVPTVVENFRQSIFEERRALFLFMAGGNIAPDHHSYVHLRSSMNAILRHAEHITFMRGLMAWFLYRKEAKIHSFHFARSLGTIDNEQVKERLLKHRESMNFAIIKRILFSSPFAMVCAVVIVAALLVIAMVIMIFEGAIKSRAKKSKMERKMLEPIASIETEARLRIIEPPDDPLPLAA